MGDSPWFKSDMKFALRMVLSYKKLPFESFGVSYSWLLFWLCHFFRFSSLNIWATSWENLFFPYVNNKDSDQPAHPRGLISIFVIPCLDNITPPFAISKISSLQLVTVAAQAGLSLTWSQTPKNGFLMMRLTLYRPLPLCRLHVSRY